MLKICVLSIHTEVPINTPCLTQRCCLNCSYVLIFKLNPSVIPLLHIKTHFKLKRTLLTRLHIVLKESVRTIHNIILSLTPCFCLFRRFCGSDLLVFKVDPSTWDYLPYIRFEEDLELSLNSNLCLLSSNLRNITMPRSVFWLPLKLECIIFIRVWVTW